MRKEDLEAAGLAMDADALDLIAHELSVREWSADVVADIAEIVRATGRAVDDIEGEE